MESDGFIEMTTQRQAPVLLHPSLYPDDLSETITKQNQAPVTTQDTGRSSELTMQRDQTPVLLQPSLDPDAPNETTTQHDQAPVLDQPILISCDSINVTMDYDVTMDYKIL